MRILFIRLNIDNIIINKKFNLTLINAILNRENNLNKYEFYYIIFSLIEIIKL